MVNEPLEIQSCQDWKLEDQLSCRRERHWIQVTMTMGSFTFISRHNEKTWTT